MNNLNSTNVRICLFHIPESKTIELLSITRVTYPMNQSYQYSVCLFSSFKPKIYSLFADLSSYDKRIIITAFAAFGTSVLFQNLAHWKKNVRVGVTIEIL
jgi:hypothetical protein